MALMECHFALVIELISNRCWSQAFYGFCFPYLVASVYCPGTSERTRGARLMTKVCSAVLKLEDFVSRNPFNSAATALLQSIATHEWQVTREIFALGCQSGWTWDSDDLRATAWAIFSGPMTTKSTLESGFNHLRDRGHRHSRNDKMSNDTRYSYLATQPYARGEKGGAQQVRPPAADFDVMAREVAARNDIYALKLFHPTATKMPMSYPHPQDIVKKWRPAGFLANKVAAAAAALAVNTAPRNFANISNAWSGTKHGEGWARGHRLRLRSCIGLPQQNHTQLSLANPQPLYQTITLMPHNPPQPLYQTITLMPHNPQPNN